MSFLMIVMIQNVLKVVGSFEIVTLGGHYPGNQGHWGKVRESEKGLKIKEKSGESLGIVREF